MKQHIIYSTLFIGLLMMGITGCKKIAGLHLQENTDHTTSILDAHINKTARQYLKERQCIKPHRYHLQTDVRGDYLFGYRYRAVSCNQAKHLFSCITMRFSEPLLHKPTDNYWSRYKVWWPDTKKLDGIYPATGEELVIVFNSKGMSIVMIISEQRMWWQRPCCQKGQNAANPTEHYVLSFCRMTGTQECG